MTSTTPLPPRPWRDLRPGERAVVRRRLSPAEAQGPGSGAGHVWTDVIGYVLEVSDGGVRLRTDPRHGTPEEVLVPADEIEAARQVPPRPPRRVPRYPEH